MSSGLSRCLPALGCERGPNLAASAAQSRPVIIKATPARQQRFYIPAFFIAPSDWRSGALGRVFFFVKAGQGRADVLDIETPALGFRLAAAFPWDVPQARCPHCVLLQASNPVTTALCALVAIPPVMDVHVDPPTLEAEPYRTAARHPSRLR